MCVCVCVGVLWSEGALNSVSGGEQAEDDVSDKSDLKSEARKSEASSAAQSAAKKATANAAPWP